MDRTDVCPLPDGVTRLGRENFREPSRVHPAGNAYGPRPPAGRSTERPREARSMTPVRFSDGRARRAPDDDACDPAAGREPCVRFGESRGVCLG